MYQTRQSRMIIKKMKRLRHHYNQNKMVMKAKKKYMSRHKEIVVGIIVEFHLQK